MITVARPPSQKAAYSPSIAHYYNSLLSGILNIDDQYRNPNINNRYQITNIHREELPQGDEPSASSLSLDIFLFWFGLENKVIVQEPFDRWRWKPQSVATGISKLRWSLIIDQWHAGSLVLLWCSLLHQQTFQRFWKECICLFGLNFWSKLDQLLDLIFDLRPMLFNQAKSHAV